MKIKLNKVKFVHILLIVIGIWIGLVFLVNCFNILFGDGLNKFSQFLQNLVFYFLIATWFYDSYKDSKEELQFQKMKKREERKKRYESKEQDNDVYYNNDTTQYSQSENYESKGEDE